MRTEKRLNRAWVPKIGTSFGNAYWRVDNFDFLWNVL